MSEGLSHQHLTSDIGHLDPAHRLQRQQGALVRLSWRGTQLPIVRNVNLMSGHSVRAAGPVRGRIVSRCWTSGGNELSLRWFSPLTKLRCRAMSDVGGKAEIICSF